MAVEGILFSLKRLRATQCFYATRSKSQGIRKVIGLCCVTHCFNAGQAVGYVSKNDF